MDELMGLQGARYIGECAIGTNPHIDRVTRNILFDEKCAKTVHFAIGSAYPETGGKHVAAIHLDFITSMQENSQIIADGNLIYNNGMFVDSLV